MRYYAAFFCVVLGGSIGIIDARADDCAAIKNPDARAFCRAVATRNPAWCSFIADADLRARCRALVKRPGPTPL